MPGWAGWLENENKAYLSPSELEIGLSLTESLNELGIFEIDLTLSGIFFVIVLIHYAATRSCIPSWTICPKQLA
jgi:hypothetical protein